MYLGCETVMSADEMASSNVASTAGTDSRGNDTEAEDGDIEALSIMPMLFYDNSGRVEVHLISVIFFKRRNCSDCTETVLLLCVK